MNRICPRCHTVYSYSLKECPNGCYSKSKKENSKLYDKLCRKNKEFYGSKEWKFLREACRKKYSNICIWTLYKHKKIVKGKIAHHIVPVEVNYELALKLDNLIFVSDEAHREIHKSYMMCGKEDFELLNKKILELIRKYQLKWETTDEGWGR